jgi:hypothetical protein
VIEEFTLILVKRLKRWTLEPGADPYRLKFTRPLRGGHNELHIAVTPAELQAGKLAALAQAHLEAASPKVITIYG